MSTAEECPCGWQPSARDPKAAGGQDVVTTLAFSSWSTAVQRQFAFSAEQLARHLLTEPRVGRLVIAEPFRSVQGRLRDTTAYRSFPRDSSTSLLTPTRLSKRADRTPEDAFRDYDRRLLAAAARRGLRQPRLIATHPTHAAVADTDRWASVTYYAWDDWSVHGGHRAHWDEYVRAYASIRSRGVAVCAVTEKLLATIAPTGPALVVPNGVNTAEWQNVGPAPAWYEALPRPRLIYAGTIGDRLDVAAFEALAAAFSSGTVALFGTMSDEHLFAGLRERANVVIAPNQARDTIRTLLAASDVGLMPHAVTPLTLTMSPLKVFEYLAAGLPAVVTDLPPVHGLHERVEIVPAGGDFVAAVRRALTAGPVDAEQRQQLFREHCWHRRFNQLLGVALRTEKSV